MTTTISTEITCELEANTGLVVEIFNTLKANNINIRKIELVQGNADQSRYYLHMEMDCLSEQKAIVDTLGSQLKDKSFKTLSKQQVS